MKDLKPVPIPRDMIDHKGNYFGQGDWSPVTGEDLPEPVFNDNFRVRVNNHWQRALKVDATDDVFDQLKQLTVEYMIELERDNFTASPGEAIKCLNALDQALDVLSKALHPINPIHKTTIGHLDPCAKHDLRMPKARLRQNIKQLRERLDTPVQTSRKDIAMVRRLKFATAFATTFKANSWPMDTGAMKLMAQVFGLCLEAAGDYGQIRQGKRGPISKLDEMLKKAVKNLPV